MSRYGYLEVFQTLGIRDNESREAGHIISYKIACAPSEDLDQTAQRNVSRAFAGHCFGSQGSKASSSSQKTLLRLHGCAGRSESSFSAHVIL